MTIPTGHQYGQPSRGECRAQLGSCRCLRSPARDLAQQRRAHLGNLGFAQASLYTNVNIASSANYEIYFTQVGVPTFVYLDSGPITFGSGQNRTIVGLNNTSGGHTTRCQRFELKKDLN